MRPRRPHELRSALEKKGFEPREADHTWYRLYVRGRKADIRTKVGHHSRDYDDRLLGQMAKQLHLKLGEFVECPLTYDAYIDLMRERGRLPAADEAD